jgi:hypothetical protein
MKDRVLELLRVPASDIEGAPWNWRKHNDKQRQATKGSIDELGFFAPLEVYKTEEGKYRLIDGHLRQDLIEHEFGPEQLIPVALTDFTEAEARKANLLKDPLAMMAETDGNALKELMETTTVEAESLQFVLDRLSDEVFYATIDDMANSDSDNASEGDGEPAEDDPSDDDDDGTPTYKTLTIMLTPEQDKPIRAALATAKARHGLDTTPQALILIVKEWTDALKEAEDIQEAAS